MTKSTIDQVDAALANLAKTFTVTFIAAVLTAGNYSGTTLKAAAYAGAGSVLVVIYNWLNPKDPRFGRGYVDK